MSVTEEAKSTNILADGMSGLSLNIPEELAKTKAQLKAEEIVREANALILEKKYGEAIKALKSLPNKERREYKATIELLKQKDAEEVEKTVQSANASVKDKKYAEVAEALASLPSKGHREHAATIDPLKRMELPAACLAKHPETQEITLTKNPILNRSEFCGPVEKRWISDQKGFGLVATRDVEPGELLIASNAISIVIKDADDGSMTALNNVCDHVKITVSRIADNERLKREVYGLYAGPGYRRYLPDEPIPATVDPARVACVLKYNAFGFSIKPNCMGLGPRGRGLWVLPSFINHSCTQNCTRVCFGDLMVVRAQKKISQGEELTLCYAITDREVFNYEQRQARLSSVYGINCACPLCECDKENLSVNPLLNVQREKFIRNFDGKEQALRLNFTSLAQVKAFYKDSLTEFEPLTYKNRHDAALGLDTFWFARFFVSRDENKASVDINKAWSALTGEGLGISGFVVSEAMELLSFCELGLFNLQHERNAKGPEAIDLAKKLLKYAKILYGAKQPLEMLLLMSPDNPATETAVTITRKLLKAL